MSTTLPGTGKVISSDVLNATTGLNGGVPDATGEEVQRAKVTFGSDGFSRDVDAANPLPVGAASLPLPTGASTEATLAALNTKTSAVTTLWVTATAATGVAATATLPAAGVGLFHYITAIDIQLYATAARTGGVTPVIVTSTNLPGSPAWPFPTAQAIGAVDRYDVPLMTALKSNAANTATTIAAPVATAGLWRINVGYYTAA